MASPAELVNAISLATGVPLATMVDIDRKLVKAKLRSKGGRGFSAAQMTSLDAARLLTGILGSSRSNEAAQAVNRYAQTVAQKGWAGSGIYGDTRYNDLVELQDRHGFVEALAALIESATNGSLSKAFAKNSKDFLPSIGVYAFTGATRGRIRISGLVMGLTASVDYQPVNAAKTAKPSGSGRGDLEQSRRITEQTIYAIANVLREEM